MVARRARLMNSGNGLHLSVQCDFELVHVVSHQLICVNEGRELVWFMLDHFLLCGYKETKID